VTHLPVFWLWRRDSSAQVYAAHSAQALRFTTLGPINCKFIKWNTRLAFAGNFGRVGLYSIHSQFGEHVCLSHVGLPPMIQSIFDWYLVF